MTRDEAWVIFDRYSWLWLRERETGEPTPPDIHAKLEQAYQMLKQTS